MIIKDFLVFMYTRCYDLYITIVNDIIAAKHYPEIRPTQEAITRINEEHCSMSRFGDGEFSLICGDNLKFQPYDAYLAEELRMILKFSDDTDGLLVCIPDIFKDTTQYIPRAEKYWNQYLHLKRSKVYALLRFDKIYYNTQITRFYIDYIDKSKMSEKVQELQSIWNNKKILIVEGEKSRLGMGNDFFLNATCINRIICPAVNAYAKIDEIEAAVLEESNFDLALIALGPTATVLSYRLYKKGIQALDIGHIDIEYEWYKKGAQEKEPVAHKYIGEMNGGDIVDDAVDEIYQSQIIRRIV